MIDFGGSIDEVWNIGLHLKNIFKSGELVEDSVAEKNSATAADGKSYVIKFYNLDAIIMYKSDENRKPTYEDSCVPLGCNITDYTTNIGDVQSGTTYYSRIALSWFWYT